MTRLMELLKRVLFYMDGRYGMDEFSRVLMVTGLLLSALSNIIGGRILAGMGVAALAFGALRPLSKEIDNRQKEYRWYITIKQKITTTYNKLKNKQIQSKTFKVYKCPECKQKVRVPKGRKKIRITCPACQHKFVKKT